MPPRALLAVGAGAVAVAAAYYYYRRQQQSKSGAGKVLKEVKRCEYTTPAWTIPKVSLVVKLDDPMTSGGAGDRRRQSWQNWVREWLSEHWISKK